MVRNQTGQIDPENHASGADIQHISKSSSNWLGDQYWWETNGFCFRKRLEFWNIWGTKWPKNQAYDAHNQHTSKSKQKTDAKPVETFRKYDQNEILTNLGPKKARQSGLWDPYSTHL